MEGYKPDMSLYAGINPNKLPKVWYPHYVVYKYGWAKSTYIVGFESDETAYSFQNELLKNKDIVRCETFGHYPPELLKDET